VSTLATEKDDGFVINGLKTWVTDGPVASFFTVLCQTDPAKKLKGLNFFFVPRDFPGVSVSKSFDLLGTRTTPICELSLNNVKIPFEYRLGEDGRGTSNLLSILAEIRTMTAALGIGLVRAALADCIQYAHERVAFGKTIGSYQLIQAKVAEMYVDLEASRLLTYKASAI
jgi:alkylation response protein AidB-like acyl-CoA dehydrogenase